MAMLDVSRATVTLLGVLLSAVLPARAESPVNFSGTWELDRTRSVLSSLASSAPSTDVTLVIDHQGESVKIERRVKIMGVNRSLTSTYYADGREASNLTPRGDTVISRSRWEGMSLVTVSRGTVTLGGKKETIEATDVRRLTEDGKVLLVNSTIVRPGRESPERSQLVFVRK